MLLISRKAQQQFSITTPDGVITVLVMGFEHMEGIAYVRLGIDAPKDFAIHRDNARVKRTSAQGGLSHKEEGDK